VITDKEFSFLEKKFFKENIVDCDFLIKDLIKILNKTGFKIILVNDKKNKFLGTISDGDIRRGLIKGLDLNDSCKTIINLKPKYLKNFCNKYEIKKLMILHNIEHIPVIDKKNYIKGVYTTYGKEKIQKILDVPVVLMAGGKGERLMPLTKNKPKPMVLLNGKPIIEHIISKASMEGFYNFYISVNYLSKKIIDYFGNGKHLGVKINYIREKKYLGTAGSLFYLKKKIKKSFLVINADVISDIKYKNLLNFHLKNRSLFTIAVSKYESTIPFGVVKVKGNNLLDFQEKPTSTHYINAGVYAVNNKTLGYFKKPEHMMMPELLLKPKIKKHSYIYPLYENWSDLGSKEDLKKVRKKK
jgi:dTDP-glucose pyrophosphorylase